MSIYYLIDPLSRRLLSGPHVRANEKDPVKIGAVFTDIAPPVPGAEEIVLADGEGGWDVVEGAAHPALLPTLTHLEFMRLLRPDQIGRWRRRVKAALEAETPTEMDDVIVAADQHFSAAHAIEMEHPDTKAAIYIMYAEGAFGPFYDGTGEPTAEQLAAIEEADRVGRAERPA